MKAVSILIPILLFAVPLSFAQTNPVDVTIDAPTNNQIIYSSTVYFSGEYKNAGTVQISIDGGIYQYVTVPQTGTWNYNTSFSQGIHIAKIQAVDASGKTKTLSVTFQVVTGHVNPTKYNMILIEYSGTCEAMLKHGDNSTCPTLDKLMPFDTTNQTYSGKFVKDSHGQWTKTKPMIKNYWIFFDKFKQKIVCVDCPFNLGTTDLAPVILIEPHGFTYLASGSIDSTIQENNTSYPNNQLIPTNNKITLYDDRYVTPDCMIANLVFNKTLLADTIYYMNSGCIKTNFNNTSYLQLPHTPVDFKNCMRCHYDNWLSTAKQVTADCIHHKCKIYDPFKNW